MERERQEDVCEVAADMGPRPLLHRDIFKTAKTIFDAFNGDPLCEYLLAGQRPNKFVEVSYHCLRLCIWSRRKVLGNTEGYSLTWDDHILNWVYTAIRKFDTREQKKRLEEVIEKTRRAIDESRLPQLLFEDMLLVEILAVEPNSQRQGNGGALLDCVLRYADRLGKWTWLHCSNVKNVTFYNRHGFQTITEVVLGDDNPEWDEPPVIRPIVGCIITIDLWLTNPDVGRASKTWTEAFIDDPQMSYLRDGQTQSPFFQWIDKVCMSAYLAIAIPSTIALTIKRGEAFIIAKPARSASGPKKPLDRLLQFVQRGVAAVLKRSIGTSEQRKRNYELDSKMRDALDRLFGDAMKDMLTVNILASHPAVQRQGHGGALLDAVNSLADFTGQTAWLQCSNAKNTAFYNQHGYETVGELRLGDCNPEWHNQPVVISIVSSSISPHHSEKCINKTLTQMVRVPRGRGGHDAC
ncbi:hypothetical protein CVT24_010638 [Panaeolus cyanescens]|uniref:N-acetyltransferase domain-containing protein n=1 Tax=Panaeolus cyanescens TaxID=181874 RepID=A0A409YLV1_9AGAR|nr:hypothetical protein CVT24_010638 [Panaeolus cyanescens]